MCNLRCYCERNFPASVGLFGDKKKCVTKLKTTIKTTIKTEILPLNVVDDLFVSVLFPVNVFWPKFAAAGLPTNLRNAQLASFF